MKKIILRVLAAATAFLLIGFIFNIANAFVGNPISKNIASHAIKQYVNENYKDMDLEVSQAQYNFKFSNYYAMAQSKTSKDTHFMVSYSDGNIHDSYKEDVLSGWNTFKRLDEEYNNIVTRLIKDHMSYESDILIGTLDKTGTYATANLELDVAFDILNLPLDGYVTAYFYTDDVSWENVAKVAKELDGLMQDNQIPVKEYDVVLQVKPEQDEKRGESLRVSNFPREMLAENNLPQVMEAFETKQNALANAQKDAEIEAAEKAKQEAELKSGTKDE